MTSLGSLIKWYISGLNIFYKKQGTSLALYERRLTVGCSELFSATSTKSSKITLIKRKLDVNKQQGKIIPLVWGHLYEPTTKLYTEILLDCEIHEAPASVRNVKDGGITSCSPDGIGEIVVNFNVFKRIYSKQFSIKDIPKSRGNYVFNGLINFAEPLEFYKRNNFINNDFANSEFVRKFRLTHFPTIALFEFKSPYSRNLEKKIKQEYIYQVLGGLNIIEICDVGVYSECRFMVCNIEQFRFDDKFLNFRYGNVDDSGLFSFDKPKMIGCKFFIVNDGVENPFEDIQKVESESCLHKIMDALTVNIDYTIVDCCYLEEDKYSSAKLFEKFTRELSINVGEINVERFNNYVSAAELVEYVTGFPKVFGYMYWKLMDNNIAYVNNVYDFVESHSENVNDILKTVSLLSDMDNMDAHATLDSLKKVRVCRESCIYEEVKSVLNV